MSEQPEQPWIHHVDHHQPHHAEGQQVAGAYAAVEVEALVAVIPPAGVEQLFHQPAGDVLQYPADHHGLDEHAHGLILDGGEQGGQQHGAHAVNGAIGADQEAPVDEPPELDGLDRDLHHPPQEAADEEQQYIAPEHIAHRDTRSLLHSSEAIIPHTDQLSLNSMRRFSPAYRDSKTRIALRDAG